MHIRLPLSRVAMSIPAPSPQARIPHFPISEFFGESPNSPLISRNGIWIVFATRTDDQSVALRHPSVTIH